MLDNYSSDPANWYKTGTLFPQAPAQPRIALMVFNKEQNRYVYSRLLPFSSGNAEGEYQTKVRIPKGESEFYAFYAPNQTGKGSALLYPREESCRTRFHGISSGKA